MKKALAFAVLSLFSLLLWVSTVHAGTYTSSDFYNVTITTSEVTATGKITIPSKPPFDPGPYNISISVTTGSPDADCSPNCVYYKEVKNITKTTVETFTLEQLDPTKKYSLVIKSLDANKTLAPRVIPFQVEGVKKYTAVATTTTIAASLTGLRGNTNKFRLLVKTQPFEVADIKRFMLGGVEAAPGLPLHPGVDVIKKPDANGEIRWNLGDFYPGTTYYTRVIEYSDANDPSKAFYTTEQKTVLTQAGSISPDQLVFEYNNGSLLIKGRVDPAKNSGFEKYDIKIQYSKDELNTFTDTYPPKRSIYPGHSVRAAEPTIPNDKGEYYLFISSGINPSTTYNIRETITLGGTKKITDGVFNTGTGYTPSTSANIQEDFEDRSYRLLAPFPGLNILLDPDLCQEQVDQGKQVFGGSCDDQVSAFINLILKILIGAAAVLLVLRIMYEGYNYIMTDIPKIKLNAKSGLKDAVLGLVLALSSFLILNTINPKLIENTVNLDRLEISVEPGVDGFGLLGTGKATSASDTNWAKSNGRKTTMLLKNGGTVTIIPCDESQIQSIIAFGKPLRIHKNLVPSIKRIDAKWQAMPSRYAVKSIGGYNCRTIANSNKLSYHAYGVSIDINEATNGVNYKGNKGDIPASFIKLWTEEGWGWGGNWTSYKDPMHFSKGAGGELGDMKGE
jgi:hypothetical protein